MRTFYSKQMIAPTVHPSWNDLGGFEDCVEPAARLLKLLASEQRLLLLCRLVEGEASVGDLADNARLAPSAASQHLARMRAEGLVATRRDAQTIYYRLDDPSALRVLHTLRDIYRGQQDAPAGSAGPI
ncbi:ArsR/SmtB family transcription factor [Brevundimonas sp. DC300-4]|uniref:ArsR/SmtB family transcription factor n=1 Tax=unclassified Brevundimonas TaxID=2622653 RepID=UPI003CEE9547